MHSAITEKRDCVELREEMHKSLVAVSSGGKESLMESHWWPL